VIACVLIGRFLVAMSFRDPQAAKVLGIVGVGRIGRRVGELAHALGMSVLAEDRVRSETAGLSTDAGSSW
jgi:phosphoglycerate dehydrogenase-like enzyme